MAIRTYKGKYKCGYCGKIYDRDQEADTCKQSHNLLYLPLSAEDINRLHLYLYNGDENLLTESLIKQIKKYAKVASLKEKDV